MSEHQFITETLDKILVEFAKTSLFGITEPQRRTFDYACVLERDLSRPLVSQVMWGHSDGIEKDIRTLLHDSSSTIKTYFVKDQTRTRARLDEILRSYKGKEATAKLLTGLRLFFIPSDFDIAKERERKWLHDHLEQKISTDILFQIVFGQITKFDMVRFASHNGPFGLKYLILHEVTVNSLRHMPTFKERIGYRTTGPIREALAMLASLGLIKGQPQGNMYFPSVKGRFLLDLTRRILFELRTRSSWSEELSLALRYLGLTMPDFSALPSISGRVPFDPIVNFIWHAESCESTFGRDLLGELDPERPLFFSHYTLPEDAEFPNEKSGISNSFFSEPSSLIFFE